MNFQNIPPVPNHKELIDLAFSRARNKIMKKYIGDRLLLLKTRETTKLDVIKDDLVHRLQKVLDTFPETEKLPEFYQVLMKLTLDYPQLKKSLGAVNWAIQKVRSFQKDFVRKIIKEQNQSRVNPLAKQFYGRVSSIIKQINSNLVYLEGCRRMMRSYPDIKEMFTVCIYGFPNVGKSTLLNKLSGTKAEVAEYAFTTKGINSGFLKIDGKRKVQILDVPGTLARDEKMNNIEMIAELVVKELADIIIYVFDPSEYCGYGLKKQKRLYQNLGKKKPVYVYFSKLDLLEDSDVLKDLKVKHYSLEELQEKIMSMIPLFEEV
ncbi:MAG: GTPase [Candidatus Woesearchaeota archaeon]